MKFTLPAGREKRDGIIGGFQFVNGVCELPETVGVMAARNLVRFYHCTVDGDLGDIEVVGVLIDERGQPIKDKRTVAHSAMSPQPEGVPTERPRRGRPRKVKPPAEAIVEPTPAPAAPPAAAPPPAAPPADPPPAAAAPSPDG